MAEENVKQQTHDYYVYMLVDSRNNQPFYIGKGKGKRYLMHEHENRKDEEKNEEEYKEKIKRIKEIKDAREKVDHYIVHWNLTEVEAFRAEASLIDFCKFCNKYNVCPSFTNIQGGHDGEHGMMLVDGDLRFEDNNLPAFDVKKDHCILIKLKDNDFDTKDKNRIYDRAREAWKIGKDVINGGDARYVLVCHNNRITDIFKVSRWYKVKSVGDQWEECGIDEGEKFGFEGKNITENITGNLAGNINENLAEAIARLDDGQLTPEDKDIISRYHYRIFKGEQGGANPYRKSYDPKKE